MKNEFNMHSRVLFQDLRDEANAMALVTPNHCWKRAYENLRDAADRLDAMMSRNTVAEIEEAIKLCPFCGSSAKLFEDEITCQSCGASISGTEETLIAAWNKRT